MKFVLTAHAALEAHRRQIPLHWIDSVMEMPEQVCAGASGRKILQSRMMGEGGKVYLVRVVVEDWVEPPVVVTVYRTSKIEKYWSSHEGNV